MDDLSLPNSPKQTDTTRTLDFNGFVVRVPTDGMGTVYKFTRPKPKTVHQQQSEAGALPREANPYAEIDAKVLSRRPGFCCDCDKNPTIHRNHPQCLECWEKELGHKIWLEDIIVLPRLSDDRFKD